MNTLKYHELGGVVMRELAGIKPGERVTIIADTATDPGLSHAYLGAALAAGGEAVLVVERNRPLSNMTVPETMASALAASDVVLGIGASVFSRTPKLVEARERGTRILLTDPNGMEDYLLAGILHIDNDLMFRRSDRLAELVRSATSAAITSDNGTDMTFDLGERPVIVGDGRATEPGVQSYYPGSQVSVAPVEESIEGSLVVDGSISTLGLISEPFTLQVRAGRIVAVEGTGADAAKYKRHIDDLGDEKLQEACHFSWGLNPKARLSGNIYEDERYLGCLDIGWGSQEPEFGGTVGPSKHHVDTVFVDPSLILDGETVIEKNRLLFDVKT